MKTFDQFCLAYIEAALWSSNDNADIHPDTLALMEADCTRFQSENAADLAAADYGSRGREYGTDECAGHDFWLTRNGHGVGFWDRDLGALGDRLTKAAKAFGEFTLYLGDDGMIHGS